MAKELPYFQFEPAEYLTKDISFCSLSAQGLFVNICSYYWQRKCELTKGQLLRRLNYEDEFNELLKEGVIDLDGENIIIKFLDLQLENATKTSKTNSKNGAKGGRPKKPKESEIKPKQNPIESETKGIREDKIKEDNIIYTENEFLEDWTQCRKTFLKVPTNFKSIKTYDLPKFNKAVNDYSKDQIREAMRGLFMQEVISFSSMTLHPSHFLENVDKYYNAFISKDKKLYGSKPVQQ